MHGFANPKRFLALANPLTPLLLVGGLAMATRRRGRGRRLVPTSAKVADDGKGVDGGPSLL